ncbi:Replication protein O [Cohnella nanjingensis]|uniref:Replication protein O n=1 Tax=Cohnella nanjingensis TaxID=1387779 RepID=A0A7X0RS87_9BACL|nr:Replication protein O [Cohnella nanjingensis]MBB6672605.1 Replication protein O [Cohnella nanjingensis]
MPGYISLHRDIQKHWLYEEDRVFSRYEAWLDILMRVNHAEGKTTHNGTVEVVPRGSTIWSMGDMEKHWGWSNKKVKRFLDCLERDQMLSYKSTTKKTYLTVINYDIYQGGEEPKAPPMHHRSTTEAFQKHTNNNVNNDNKENKEPKTNRRKQVYDIDSIPFRSANYLYEQILVNSPDLKKPNLQNWANDMRKLIEIDKREPIQIARLIEWVSKDQFWSGVILSAESLRKNWDKLIVAMNRGDSNAKYGRRAKGYTAEDIAKATRDDDLASGGLQVSGLQGSWNDDHIRNI